MTDRYPISIKIGDRPLYEAVAFYAGIINNNIPVRAITGLFSLLKEAIRTRDIDYTASYL